MADLIWYDLFEELNSFFQANNLSDFKGYAHRPQTVDSTVNKYYYFELQSENNLNIFDLDGTRIAEDDRPFLTFDIFVGTKATDATDQTRQSANLAMYNAQTAIRNELYNYRYNNGDLVTYPLYNCLYSANIDNIQEFPQQDGSQGVDISQMTITIFYNKTGV